ncbi:hypothetical protein TorRG33x02_304720 [Trema orientale]|uniref:Transposase, Ptta/En/Spm, plant n=1 Tax=Trema orientale TaxID=63057 RepID=A0A2P5BY00_TREOI|nr:hypothetical protein TorRG33x02_304720 [Trema orientale]
MATVGPTCHEGDAGETPHQTCLGFLPRVNQRKGSKNRSLNLQEKLDSLELGQRLPISFDKTGATWRAVKENKKYFLHLIGVLVRKNTEPFHKSWAKVLAKQKAKIEPGVKKYFQYKDVSNDELPWVSQGIDRTAQDIYKNWKNELSEHFKVNGEDENNLDLPCARRSIPPDMTQEVWNKCVDYFSSEEFRGNPETREMQSIAENYRQRYMDPVTGMWPSEEVEQNYSQVSSSASGSSTQSAPPRIDETLIADEVLVVRRGALARLVPGFHMSIQPSAAPDILPIPSLPTLPSRFRSEPLPPTFDTQDNADEDDTDLDS